MQNVNSLDELNWTGCKTGLTTLRFYISIRSLVVCGRGSGDSNKGTL
jgi:hypothetical protein